MKVSTKLYASVGTLVVVGMLVAGIGIWSHRTLGGDLDEVIGKTAVKLDQVNSLRARSWEMVATMRATFVFGSLKDSAKVDDSMNQWKAAYRRANEIVCEMRPPVTTEDGKRLLARFESSLSGYQSLATEYMQLCKEGKFEQVAPLAPRVAAAVDETEKIGMEFRALQLKLRGRLDDAVAGQVHSDQPVAGADGVGYGRDQCAERQDLQDHQDDTSLLA